MVGGRRTPFRSCSEFTIGNHLVSGGGSSERLYGVTLTERLRAALEKRRIRKGEESGMAATEKERARRRSRFSSCNEFTIGSHLLDNDDSAKDKD